jgi:hypothetical protein
VRDFELIVARAFARAIVFLALFSQKISDKIATAMSLPASQSSA